jgi:hypothetical protein
VCDINAIFREIFMKSLSITPHDMTWQDTNDNKKFSRLFFRENLNKIFREVKRGKFNVKISST